MKLCGYILSRENSLSLPASLEMSQGILTARLTDSVKTLTTSKLPINVTRFSHFRPFSLKFPASAAATSRPQQAAQCLIAPVESTKPSLALQSEEIIEKAIYSCRFLAILAVWGSLVGSFLCFFKGCTYVVDAYRQYFVNRTMVIFLLVESIDVYLLGTVLLVFGMGLYELFISNLDIPRLKEDVKYRSNLFGLFTLKERPKWLEIKSVNELKTKLGHVIVMLLLIGLLEKSKKAAIQTSFDLLCFSASVLLSSGCLYLLSKLNGSDD